MPRKLSVVVGAALILLLGLSGTAHAQGTVTGSVQGVVRDPDGGVLPGATVTVVSKALVRGRMTTTSDARGGWRFPALPPGMYAFEAELQGFKKVQRAGVRVGLGQALAIDLVLPLTSVAAEAIVTAEAPVVSVVSNNVSTSFGGDYINKQAVPRNYYQVISSAPGVNLDTGSSGSAILAYGATTENQNAFTLDGVNVADSGGGGHWLLPSIQWMEEIQVSGLGANAEFGGYTGGIVNGVTKSGGNEFHGALEAYYQPESWVANNDPTGGQETFKFEDGAASLGGPLAKDKLWFFGSAEYWHQISTPIGAEDTSDRKIPRFLGKLTYQPNEKSRIFAMGEYDNVTNDRRGISTYVTPDASQKQEGPDATFALNWELLANSSNFFNVKLTGNDGRDDYFPYHGADTSGHYDYYNTELEVANAQFQNLSHRHLVTGEATWSLFKDGLFGKNDSHSFKVGALYETASASDSWRRNGGYTYYDDSSSCDSLTAYRKDPTCGYYERSRGYGEYEEHGEHKGYTVYAQDSVRFSRLTVNAGLRYTGYRAGWQPGYGDSNVYKADFVDPRLGFVWDVAGDGRWAVKGHWGSYHSAMYLYLYDRETSGHASLQAQDSEFDPDTKTWGPWIDAGVPLAAPIGDISHPSVDETLFTVEHQLGKDVSLGLDFIDRRFKNIMGLVNTNTDYTAVSVSNPYTGGTLQFWTLNSPQKYVLTTDNAGYRTYDSLVMRFDKRYSKGWQLRSSLVWTDLKGNVLKNNGYAAELEDRNGLVNADGRMDQAYNEWEYKLSGAVDLPFGIVASGQYTFLSGWYYQPYGRVSPFLDYNDTSAGRYVNLTERGAEKLPSRNIVDLRLAWGTRITGDSRLELSLECFNVLNTARPLSIDTYYARYRSGKWQIQSNYGNATSIEAPRQLRAGVRLLF